MKKIWGLLITHVKADFHPGYYGAVFVFLVICITLNFTYDIEDSHIDTLDGISRFVSFFAAHALAWFVPVFLGLWFRRKSFRLSREFWLRSIIALALLSLERSNLLLDPLVDRFDFAMQHYAHKVLNNFSGIVLVVLPLYLFFRWKDQRHTNFYGLTTLPFDVRPYFILLAIAIPMLAVASFNKGFQHQYPMYVETGAYIFLEINQWITVAVYEFAYAVNFVSIEFFYRGFLVLGMASVLGRSSVLPMACLYCFLHFGKPAPEAISSIFGGYLLGVISFETRSIWGGIIVHIGIAWSMELLAFLQKQWNS